jgi:hypothetical protein
MEESNFAAMHLTLSASNLRKKLGAQNAFRANYAQSSHGEREHLKRS